jgi:hypothetical protein
MLSDLNRTDRMRLMKFVCSFVWADLEVAEEERDYVAGLIRRLHLHPREKRQVERWLAVPPRPEEVDPTDIPVRHRQLFLNAVRHLSASDGSIDPEERIDLALFKELLGAEGPARHAPPRRSARRGAVAASARSARGKAAARPKAGTASRGAAASGPAKARRPVARRRSPRR